MDYKYEPKTKTALIAAIRDEIKLHGNRADLNCINTAAIKNMRELFYKFKSFDGDISGWNVSNVTDMSDMFTYSQFNGDISGWDVSNVTDMTRMFSHSRFRGDISKWDVDKVEYFFPMFRWADISEEHKPVRFRRTRDASSPVLFGKKVFNEEAEVAFTLTGDGVLTLSGNLKCNLDYDYYRGLGDLPVREVILTEGITEIGKNMFYSWKHLEEVTFPESLTKIGEQAFECCHNLARLNFPKRGLIKIGSSAFSSCCVRELHLPETVTSIGSYAFSSLEQLEELTLPDSLMSVGQRDVFKKCTSLKSIKLPAYLKEIPDSMFWGCSALEYVQMPVELEKIGGLAFSSCPNLKKIELPDTVQCVADDAFESLSFEHGGLDYYVSNYITNLAVCCVSAKDWEGELDIPSSVCHEGRSFIVSEIDFSGCKHLTRARIPDTVTSLPYNAFTGCTALRSVEIPSSVTSIGAEAFAGCEALKSVELPDTVTEIPARLFQRCWRLRNVRLGANTTSIGEQAFEGCEFLQHLHLPDSVRSILISAFEGCKNLVDLGQPKHLEYIDLYAFDGTALQKMEDGPIYVGNALCGYSGSIPKHACLKVREGTTVIAEAALRGWGGFESVILPESLEHIGYEAFNDCKSLKHVHLPKSLKELGSGAFDGTSISEVDVPWTTPITTIYCPFPRSSTVYVPKGALAAYEKDAEWRKYKLLEKEDCGSDNSSFIGADTVIVGEQEKYRVILVENPPHKSPWKLYGAIVSAKSAADPRRAVKDLLFESFRDTGRYLDLTDWSGDPMNLSEELEYDRQRFAVIDLPEDASPQTQTFDGRKYLTDEAFYNSMIAGDVHWEPLEK